MGSDIYAHLEVKLDGRWVNYTTLNIERSYRLFARMAGVRNHNNEIAPVAPPRGLPKDASDIVLCEYEDIGGHSASWLSIDEMLSLVEWLDGDNEVFGYREFGALLADLDKRVQRCARLASARLVFWFES